MPYLKFAPAISAKTDSKICKHRFELVSKHIHKRIDKSIRSQDLAEMLDISPSYLSRQFRQYAGVSVTNYILMWRLNVAKHMLSHTKRSLVDISISCGFSSQSHLQSAFKRMEGVTPGDWRAMNGGQADRHQR